MTKQYDSFLGALFQQTLYSTKQQKVVKTALATDPGIESIGGSDIFSNDHVRLPSCSAISALLRRTGVHPWLMLTEPIERQVNLMSTLTVAWNLVRIDQLLLKQ